MELLKYIYRVWAMHREFQAVLAELNGYSDRQLTDLGLSRVDVPRLAYEEAERRILTPATDRGDAAAAASRNPALVPGE